MKQKVGDALPHFRTLVTYLDLKSGVPQAVQLRTNFVGKLYLVLAAEKDAKVLMKMSGVEKEKVLVFDPVAEMRRIDEEFQAMDRP